MCPCRFVLGVAALTESIRDSVDFSLDSESPNYPRCTLYSPLLPHYCRKMYEKRYNTSFLKSCKPLYGSVIILIKSSYLYIAGRLNRRHLGTVQLTMDSNTDGDNLNLSSGENDNDNGDELRIAADETYDTRSEVSSSSSNSDSSTTHPTISSVSSKSSRGDNKRSRRNRSKRGRSRDSKSSSPEPKRARSKDSKGTTKNYDYTTKLNYLFRDARFDKLIYF